MLHRINEGVRKLFRPFHEFVERHEDAWELGMAALAIAFVLTGFAGEARPEFAPQFDALDWILTIVFVLEFALRLAGSPSRPRYFKDHLLDLIALVPLARGVRVLRLLRLLRLVRAWTGIHHAFMNAERLTKHHEFGTLVIAWLGVTVIGASAFYLAENDVNPAVSEPGDAIWWGIAILAGGATAVRPVTDEGRFITAVMLIFGVALFTSITAVLVSFLVRQSSGAEPLEGSPDGEAAPAVARDSTASAGDRLREIATLRDQDLIDATEYDRARAAILRHLER